MRNISLGGCGSSLKPRPGVEDVLSSIEAFARPLSFDDVSKLKDLVYS